MIKNSEKTECFDLNVFFSCKHSVLSELFIMLVMLNKSRNGIYQHDKIKFHPSQVIGL